MSLRYLTVYREVYVSEGLWTLTYKKVPFISMTNKHCAACPSILSGDCEVIENTHILPILEVLLN